MKNFSYQVKIKKEEVLRYLGYKTGDLSSLSSVIDECISVAEKTVRPKHALTLTDIRPDPEGLFCRCGIVLPGHDIAAHLQGCHAAVIFAATAGIEIDRLISQYKFTDMTRCVILDACGTAAIEDYCDAIENHIRQKFIKENLYLTSRFSCGYGDLPLSLQPFILEKTEAYKKTLISCNDRFMLIPAKSVSAIMGICKTPPKQSPCKQNCKVCDMQDTCIYKRND